MKTAFTSFNQMAALFEFLGISAKDLQSLIDEGKKQGETISEILIPRAYFNGIPLRFADVKGTAVRGHEK